MSIGINTNYGTNNYIGVNGNTEPDWTKNDDKGKEKAASAAQSGVIYDKQDASAQAAKSEKADEKAIYKKSKEDRAAIVQQLKAAEEQQRNNLISIVQKTLQGQVGAYGTAKGDDFWRQLAGGKFTVDAATKAQAQKDISEDGYYGVKQTSQRLFDFASALAGDDVDKMKEMQKAMEKGFKQATKTWGRELPSICKETMNAANKLFEDYYSSKEKGTEA
ncbi:hypothetical protein [Butyrivibrio sp. TB]|uniref:hypothetical protein n=1 Tax=Butyrivibrio sp. TB TaxID=1520809 RepID=UPI0008AA884B|nr:hypothetical protein [Butyrivibrio sp. TB]SEP76855.1 hypothetical protein SAMN02910382_00964 [Butyrivibrio sp. TB]